MIRISWNDARAYTAWLNANTSGGFRLPSEAEWEYACRTRTRTSYWTGKYIHRRQAMFDGDNTAPVGAYPANAFGLCDMAGNVWEWCEDMWRDTYDGAPIDGSARLDRATEGHIGPSRVFRGGSWRDDPLELRSANRRGDSPVVRKPHYGFRVARSV